MTYTIEQHDSLEASIASGERRVKYEDREVEYRSLKEMQAILRLMKAELGLESKAPQRTLLAFNKGHEQRGPE